MALFLKQLIGEEISIVKPICTHCGNKDMDMEGVTNGYYRYCKTCNNIILDTFFETFPETASDAIKDIIKKKKKEHENRL